MPAASRQVLGRQGEDAVAAWYVDHGYELVDRNWRCQAGEVDLVVRRGAVLAFCEVKTRTSPAFGHPAEAVTRAKQARIRRVAVGWLRDHPSTRRSRLRFDVAGVLDGAIEVIEAAF